MADCLYYLRKKLGYVYSDFRIYLQHLGLVLLAAAVAILACSLRGDVILFSHLLYKTYCGTFFLEDVTKHPSAPIPSHHHTSHHQNNLTTDDGDAILPDYLQLPRHYNLPDLAYHIFVGVVSSEITYHLVCGVLQVYFYVLQRREPEKWKCQPHRFLTRSNEVHEIVVGTVNMFLAGAVSGFLTCWIKNGNYHMLYFSFNKHGYPYLVFSLVALFLWIEALSYYVHKMLHWPWVYRNIHKLHHRYHSPTAYSAVSMSPIELFFLDIPIIAPLFLVPLNAVVYITVVSYIYYFGLMDHSGIKMKSWFPWQPDTMFHDDHHRYFHCNFGFNTYLFDRLHGTLRVKGRLYGEKIFGGKGKEP